VSRSSAPTCCSNKRSASSATVEAVAMEERHDAEQPIGGAEFQRHGHVSRPGEDIAMGQRHRLRPGGGARSHEHQRLIVGRRPFVAAGRLRRPRGQLEPSGLTGEECGQLQDRDAPRPRDRADRRVGPARDDDGSRPDLIEIRGQFVRGRPRIERSAAPDARHSEHGHHHLRAVRQDQDDAAARLHPKVNEGAREALDVDDEASVGQRCPPRSEESDCPRGILCLHAEEIATRVRGGDRSEAARHAFISSVSRSRQSGAP